MRWISERLKIKFYDISLMVETKEKQDKGKQSYGEESP